jgi:hypothetical protein
MLRRRFLSLSLAGAGVGAGVGVVPVGTAALAAAAAPPAAAVYYLPGYRPERAHFRGRPVTEAAEFTRAIPAGHEGGVTLLTRLDEKDGSLRRALMPLVGHAIAVAPDRRVAVWASNNGPFLVSFDPGSLELGRQASYDPGAFVGGGHGVFTPDGSIALSERRVVEGWAGEARRHYGRITIREAESLKILAAYGCEGMSPHEIELTADGKHLAVANYGSYALAGDWRPRVEEPSLTIIELSSGKLVDKRLSPDLTAEVTHLAAHSLDRIASIRLVRGTREEEAKLFAGRDDIYEPDSSSFDDGAYLPGPVDRFERARSGWASVAALPDDPTLARHGQSIVFDPVHDEMLTTFTSSHVVMVTDGETGALKRVVHADAFGLRYPRGVALHPDGEHYAVSGSWQDIVLFRRGSHEMVPERALRAVFFDHSHMTVA